MNLNVSTHTVPMGTILDRTGPKNSYISKLISAVIIIPFLVLFKNSVKLQKQNKNHIINTHSPITHFCESFMGCHISSSLFSSNSKKQHITDTVALP